MHVYEMIKDELWFMAKSRKEAIVLYNKEHSHVPRRFWPKKLSEKELNKRYFFYYTGERKVTYKERLTESIANNEPSDLFATCDF